MEGWRGGSGLILQPRQGCNAILDRRFLFWWSLGHKCSWQSLWMKNSTKISLRHWESLRLSCISIYPHFVAKDLSSIVYASFSHIVAVLARLCLFLSMYLSTLGLEGMHRIHLTTNIPLQNLELLGHRQVEVEWGVRVSSTFLFLLR